MSNHRNRDATLRSLLVLIAMASLLLAAQCNTAPAPALPTPAPTVVVEAGPPPAPSGDKCQDVLDQVRAEGCTLPNDFLDACRTARAHGATFHLVCFVNATSCEAVSLCLEQAG